MRCLCAIVSCWFAFSAVAQDSAPSAAEQPATPSAQQQPAATPESTPAISTPGAPASPAPQVQGRKRAETDVLPLPLVSPRAIDPAGGIIEPLTPGGKARLALKNTFGIRAIANRALYSGLDFWMDTPEEWPSGMEGYGMRMGSRMGSLAVRQSVQLALDVALKTDPRYDRCDCVGAMGRTGHALKRVFIARKDDGTETIGIARLAGSYATPMVNRTWHPDRLNTWNERFTSGTTNLVWRGLSNIIKEFWPDMKQRVRFLPGGGPDN